MTSSLPKTLPTNSPTYQAFLKASPQFSVCQYGRSQAIGCRGTLDQINSFIMLVANFDQPRTAHWLADDFAYITIPLDRLRAAIRLYLYANIFHSGEIPTESLWDESTGTYSLTQDSTAATELADQCAAHFISSLKVQSFIPTERTTPAFEYSHPFSQTA